MQVATPETVLGDFDNATFTYNGIVTTFSRRGDDFFVTTDGEDGKLTQFPVPYVFGVYPLQQYLLPLSRGRLQALSITWDARPKEQGGQRWYHLYPDEPIVAGDPLHWTGPYQNWNTRCAECHSTDLKKNYDAKTRTFNTTYEEINVGCESCHGPGSTHIGLAATGKLIGGRGYRPSANSACVQCPDRQLRTLPFTSRHSGRLSLWGRSTGHPPIIAAAIALVLPRRPDT